MSQKNILGLEYDPIRKYIEIQRNQMNESWDSIKNRRSTRKFLPEFDMWNKFNLQNVPDWKSISEKEWNELVGHMEDAEKQCIRIRQRGSHTVLDSEQELNNAVIPHTKGSSWQMYIDGLKKNGFSEYSIKTLEQQTLDILRHLSSNTSISGPQKGLVVGNVQSGKTASMAGLMALAADNGWNYFIVLTGLTENLRQQTEARLRNDLKKTGGNLLWDYIGYGAMKDKNFEYSDFSDSRRVFFSVCLKNKTRLNLLIRFLQRDHHPDKLKILIIDDEADQGSINTGDIKEESNRKAINKLILKLVYDGGYEKKPYGAVNYVSYTATPYANCLNEFKDRGDVKTLYPESFIAHIEPGKGYFGPSVIFGIPGTEKEERLDIINFIPSSEVREIKDIEKDITEELPETLKDALVWFICAASIQRFRKSYNPVSMLIHTSFKVSEQECVYKSISEWLHGIDEGSFLDYCNKVYKEQTVQFTVEDLKKAFPEYEFLDQIEDYPDFTSLIPFIRELVSEITSIYLDDDSELKYNRGILICVDNSAKNQIDEEGKHLRLVYPDKKEAKLLGYATAFIVIGGNTLSRGLTLEGLVSSYFLRNSIQADSLMQMGRWFGYRKGYELLPRIWMTEDSFEKFQFLVEIDNDLRDQIRQMSIQGQTPTDFQLALLTSPKANWLRLTAKNKMQASKAMKLDYCGTDMQLTTYIRSKQVMDRNNRIISDFLNGLGKPSISEVDGHSAIWMDVPFNRIDKDIFKKGFQIAETSRTFQDIDSLRKWIEKETESGKFSRWTVILGGTKPSTENPEKNLMLECGHSIGKVNRSGKPGKDDKFSIKVLTNKKDYVAHLCRDDFMSGYEGDDSWNKLKSDNRISLNYKKYISASDKADVPLLLLYCIDKDSAPVRQPKQGETPRYSLKEIGVYEDFFGMAMVIPGTGGHHAIRMQISDSLYGSGDGEDED